MIKHFFTTSCKLGPNILDWIRSLYFSALGSSILSLALKWWSLSMFSFLSYFFAIIFFLLGLRYSVIIANRFKQLEKDYDKDTIVDKKKVHLHPDYLLLKDEKNKFQHFLLYILWLPAIFLLCYSGFYIENKSANSSSQSRLELDSIKNKIELLNSSQQLLLNTTQENKQLHDSLRFSRSVSNYQEKQIDSLINIIKTLTPKKKISSKEK
jgi:hypothetical protein